LCEFWRERCVRNDGRYRWRGKVHEVLVGGRAAGAVFSSATTVIHERDGAANRDPTRNLRILQSEYRRVGRSADPRLLLYLGNEHADLGDELTAISFLERYLRVSRWREQSYFAQLKLAALLCRRGQYARALQAAQRALLRIPQWCSACFSLAETYYFLQRWEQVIAWVERARRLTPPTTVCIVNPMDWRFRWIIHYTNALFHRGRLQEALHWTGQALEICPDDPLHLSNLALFNDCAGAASNARRTRSHREGAFSNG
jgi:tetratricopeptide (TPR) repeat protein